MSTATIHQLTSRPHALSLGRSPLRAEMFAAGEAARSAYHREDRDEQAYWQGVFIGYAIAFDMVSRERLAGLDLLARCGTSEELLAVAGPIRALTFSDAERSKRLLRDSGTLFGYWMGTSENIDAEQCYACGRRICTSVDPFVPCFTEAAVTCDGACHAEAHRGLGTVHCDVSA